MYNNFKKYLNYHIYLSFFLHIFFLFFLIFVSKTSKNKTSDSYDVVVSIDDEKNLLDIPIIEKEEKKLRLPKVTSSPEKEKVNLKTSTSRPVIKPFKTGTARIKQNSSFLNKKFNQKSAGNKNIKLKTGLFNNRLAKFSKPDKYTNIRIQATLIWNSLDDLDLRTLLPNHRMINYFTENRAVLGGKLDIDKNVLGTDVTNEPVENIYWKVLPDTQGYYIFEVTTPGLLHNVQSVSYKVRLKCDNFIYYFKGKITNGSKEVFIAKIKVSANSASLSQGSPYKRTQILSQKVKLSKLDNEKIKIKVD